MAIAGVLLLAFSFFGLPWISQGSNDVSFPDIRDAVQKADDAGTSAFGGGSDTDYAEVYVKGLWIFVLVYVTAAVVFSTLFVPSSHAGRVVIGTLTGGLLGAIIMAVDKEGRVAPRVNGALITGLAAIMHIVAVNKLFDGAMHVDPAYGVYVGYAGLAAILVGCIIGTRTEAAPAVPAYGYGYR